MNEVGCPERASRRASLSRLVRDGRWWHCPGAGSPPQLHIHLICSLNVQEMSLNVQEMSLGVQKMSLSVHEMFFKCSLNVHSLEFSLIDLKTVKV